MNISWLGGGFVRLEYKNLSVAINPYTEVETGVKPPRFKFDLAVLSKLEDVATNPYVNNVDNTQFILAGDGEIEKNDVFILGFSMNQEGNTPKAKNGNIFVIKGEDISLAYLGCLPEGKLTSAMLDKIGTVDILLVPVGDGDSLSEGEAIEAINDLEPKIVIPINYALPNFKNKLDS
ncbi:MAG: MBL fold metallo-hydrolase, partial [Candidatus Parcubacteria bacterium]|nr:MBL fold metallo-hydrolase [Candidatus Parcubacteria bacterium]